MADIFTKRKRSEVMSLVRSKGNMATELRLIQIFRANGITGWRRGCSLALTPRRAKGKVASAKAGVARSNNPGPMFHHLRRVARVRPDFVFPRLRVAVFVDGCFWHGCPKHATWPRTRAAFWKAKIEGNRARDRKVNRLLRSNGWVVVRVWEHELRRRNEAKLVRRLSNLCPRRP